MSLEELRRSFSPDLYARLVGCTPRGDRASPERFLREWEVREWLRLSTQPWRHWVALDDQAWLFRPFLPNLVVCNPKVGVTDRELRALTLSLDEPFRAGQSGGF